MYSTTNRVISSNGFLLAGSCPDLSLAVMGLARVRNLIAITTPASFAASHAYVLGQLDDLLENVLAQMVGPIPPISGGAPVEVEAAPAPAHDDDYEELCPEFESDPETWPGWVDEHVYELGPTQHDGPTPMSILAADDPADDFDDLAYQPDPADWAEYARWSATLGDGPLTDADLIAQGLSVG
jgi:hypothetical protein